MAFRNDPGKKDPHPVRPIPGEENHGTERNRQPGARRYHAARALQKADEAMLTCRAETSGREYPPQKSRLTRRIGASLAGYGTFKCILCVVLVNFLTDGFLQKRPCPKCMTQLQSCFSRHSTTFVPHNFLVRHLLHSSSRRSMFFSEAMTSSRCIFACALCPALRA